MHHKSGFDTVLYMQAAYVSLKAALAQQEGHVRLLQSQDEARAAADTPAPDTRELAEQASKQAQRVRTLCICPFECGCLLLKLRADRAAMSKHAEDMPRFKLLSCCHMQVIIHWVSYVIGGLMSMASMQVEALEAELSAARRARQGTPPQCPSFQSASQTAWAVQPS